MKDLKHLIYFESLLDSAHNELVRQAKEEGQLALGFTCYHMPEVLLNVDNCFSVRLRAPNTGSIDIASYYMSNYTCEYCRAVVERAIEGGYNFLDGLCGVDACAQMNRCMENIELLKCIDKPNFFVTHADIPYKYTDYTLDHYVTQMQNRVLNTMHGGSYGDLYAVGFMKDAATGEVAVREDTGAPMKQNGVADEYLGNMNAKHTLGWSNTFNYKDFSFYFLIDGKVGGKVISFTEAYLDQFGTSERTADARDYAVANNLYWTSNRGQKFPGMYIPGTSQVVPVEQYYQTIGGGSPVGRNYVYDATNFRLREISLAYTFRNLFGVSKNLTISANARNLFFLYLDAPIDPDTSLSTQNALGNVDIFGMPTTRSFGISLKASF